MKIDSRKIKIFVVSICVLFIIIDMLATISTPYELLRIIFYGIAINLLSDFITKVKRRGKK
ncbi:MAG: hypothetical protein C4539_01335 [Ignavibacteriales bacterium]|nr:MAG: hypothetical protein C4539_01335 [Ignavibacteriales bacterium]